jgi:hypothetical protein
MFFYAKNEQGHELNGLKSGTPTRHPSRKYELTRMDTD